MDVLNSPIVLLLIGIVATWFYAWMYSRGTNLILRDTHKILSEMEAGRREASARSEAAHFEIMAMIQKKENKHGNQNRQNKSID